MNRLTKKITSLFLAAAVTVGCGALPVSALDNGSTGDSYLDGVYQGTGYGHQNGKIVLDVTISGGEIEKVELVSQEEQSYWDDWGLESLFPEIVKQNSPDVDGITGATESSEGIKNAVRDALSKASAPADQDADVTAVLGSGVNTEQAASVVYGGQTWNVIGYQGQGVASDSGNLTLLMKGNLGMASFDTDFDCDYATSTLRSTLNKLAAGQTVGKLTPLSFSGAEKAAILTRTLESGSYAADGSCDGISGKPAENELVWLLSTKEALALDGTLRIMDSSFTSDQASTRWWLRSPGKSEYVNAAVKYDGTVFIDGQSLMNTQTVRPAFHLSADKIALVTAADSSDTLGLTAASKTGPWKLTLKDDAHSGFALGEVLTEEDSVSVAYTGAQTGEGEYISAAVLSGGTVTYYGPVQSLADGAAEGTATIDLSGVTMAEGDRLYVFNEHLGDSTHSNYSSALYEINLTSKDAPTFTQQPVSVSVDEGDFVEFKALASGDPEPEYTWQVNTGNGWQDIDDAEDYDYSISKVELSQNGNKYRCVATNSHGTAYSNSVTLTVTPRQLENYTIAAAPNVKGWGGVIGAGTYEETEKVTVKATANSGYQFMGWYENDELVSKDAAYTFTAAGNRTLVAVFADQNNPDKADYPHMYQGSSMLSGNANTAAADTIWYGGQAWVVVGYHGSGIVSSEDNMTLLAQDSIGTAPFAEYNEDGGTYYGNEYGKSQLKTAIDAIAAGFTDAEQSYVQKRDLAAGSYTDGYPYTDVIKGDAVSGALLWALSPNEISNDNASLNSTLKKTGMQWWLRSPAAGDYYAAYVSDSGFTIAIGTTISKKYGVRPAFLLPTADILFLSDSNSGKYSKTVGADALTPAQGSATDSWKLTMKDSTYDSFQLGDMLRSGDVITLSYSGAITGEKRYISAVVADGEGNLTYYGRLKALGDGDQEGSVEIDLSGVTLGESDTLYVFNEEYNGAGKTDYAGALQSVNLTPAKQPQDAFGFADKTVEKTYGDHGFTLAATGAAEGSKVTYSSSDPKIAAVEEETGAVTILGAGTVTITANAAETDTAIAAADSYTLTVQKATVTVTVKDQTAFIGEDLPDYSKKAPEQIYTADGLVGSDKLTGSMTVAITEKDKEVVPSTKTAGTYTLAVTGLSVPNEKNYNEIVYKTGTLTIKSCTEMPFLDVVPGSYSWDAIHWADVHDITKGKTTTSFAPGDTCTRAQAVTFLWRAAGSPEPVAKTTDFTDVEAGRYYYKALLWAVENNIVKGVTATTFQPDAKCSRAQIVTFLWRANGSPKVQADNPFTDVKADRYYADAVLWATKAGITNGVTATTFQPDAKCSRAQVVTFLFRNSK